MLPYTLSKKISQRVSSMSRVPRINTSGRHIGCVPIGSTSTSYLAEKQIGYLSIGHACVREAVKIPENLPHAPVKALAEVNCVHINCVHMYVV